MTMTIIGYGRFEYIVKSSTILVSWPILGLALQKNYIGLYSSVSGDGRPFAVGYTGAWGERA